MTDRVEAPKLITCILPKGVAVSTLSAVRERFEVHACNINNARGVGRITPLRKRGIGGQSEKQILNVVVDGERADAVFEFIYEHAQVNRPHGGIIYMSVLTAASLFMLPEDLPAEA